MQKRTSLVRFHTIAPFLMAACRALSLMAVSILAGVLVLAGCGPAMTRSSEQDF